jgi:hypothetical protein
MLENKGVGAVTWIITRLDLIAQEMERRIANHGADAAMKDACTTIRMLHEGLVAAAMRMRAAEAEIRNARLDLDESYGTAKRELDRWIAWLHGRYGHYDGETLAKFGVALDGRRAKVATRLHKQPGARSHVAPVPRTSPAAPATPATPKPHSPTSKKPSKRRR